jgi:DNA invertase Pin-like site-specific DNA recombinase
MERELIMERTRAGLEAARRQGRVGGRKRQLTDSKVELGRVGPHVVSLGAGLFADVKGLR